MSRSTLFTGRAVLVLAAALALAATTSLAGASAAETNARAATSIVTTAASSTGYVKRVWTTGFQAELNRCRGAVDVTAVYHVRTIAERSDCGGRTFPTTPGAVVTLVGLDAGRYRVIGVVATLNGRTSRISDIPKGYPLLFQTCARGYTSIRFIALAPLP